jgi:hypothetical protein
MSVMRNNSMPAADDEDGVDRSAELEAQVKSALTALAQQRVRLIVQPGNVWIVDRSPVHTQEFNSAIATAMIRGWVTTIANAVPSAQLGPNGELPSGFSGVEPIYQLTSAGWDAIHGIHLLLKQTFLVAVATLVATIIGVMVTVWFH